MRWRMSCTKGEKNYLQTNIHSAKEYEEEPAQTKFLYNYSFQLKEEMINWKIWFVCLAIRIIVTLSITIIADNESKTQMKNYKYKLNKQQMENVSNKLKTITKILRKQ